MAPFGLGGGGGGAATLVVKVVTDAQDAAKGLDRAAGGFSRVGTGLRRAAVPLGVATAGLIAFGTEAFNAASKAEQASGAVDAVFKGSSSAVHEFASNAASNMGLSASAYEEMAAVFGAQLKNMGIAADDLAPKTDDLMGLGADLAAQFGGPTSDAVGALSALLRGERDPIERYGVSIKQADIEARKTALGLDGLTGAADKQADTTATLSLLMEQTADATGAFARESDTAAGQQARATAAYEDTKAALGSALLPVVEKASELFAKVAQVIGRHPRIFQILAVAIGAVTAAVWLMNAAMAANPITLIIIGVVALVAGLVLLWDNCEAFRRIVLKMRDVAVKAFDLVSSAVDVAWGWIKRTFNWVRSNWPKLLAILTGPIGIAVLLIIRYWDRITKTISYVIGYIRGAFVAAWRWLGSVVASVIGTIRGWLSAAIQSIAGVILWVRTSLANAWRTMSNVATLVLAAIRTAIGWVIDKAHWLASLLTGTVAAAFQVVQWVATAAMGGIRAAIGWVIDTANWLAAIVRGSLAGAFQVVQWVATAAMNGIRNAIQWVIDKVSWLINAIGNIHWPSPPGWLSKAGGWLGGLVGLNMVLVPPAVARPHSYTVATTAGTRRAIRAGNTSRGASTVVNVNGALDPDAVARQIEKLLRARARRVGGVHVGAARAG